MKLKKAIEIVNYNAYVVLKGDIVSLESMDEAEINELEEANMAVKEFLYQIK